MWQFAGDHPIEVVMLAYFATVAVLGVSAVVASAIVEMFRKR